MPNIKRYANRKLYNPETKSYITLEEIAALIREGQEVQVVDNVTHEDLTALTLTQIILDQGKKESGFLPKSVLTALIQAGGDSLAAVREKLASPLDLIRQVDAEIDRRLGTLIQRGEIAEEAGKRLRGQLLGFSHLWGSSTWINEEDLEQALRNKGVPSREEFQKILNQIEALSDSLSDPNELP
jgi:polyhydroxyalkanoate synthesis repressor PhaR